MFLVNWDCTFIDYPDPNSWANIFYFSGCNHFCKSCQNQELQKYGVGTKITPDDLNNLISTLSKKNQTNKVVFSGGDPLHPHNIKDIKYFLQLYGSLYDICIYTGYDINYVKQNEITGFKFIINPIELAIFIPIITIFASILAIGIGIKSIKNISAVECCRERG